MRRERRTAAEDSSPTRRVSVGRTYEQNESRVRPGEALPRTPTHRTGPRYAADSGGDALQSIRTQRPQLSKDIWAVFGG